MKKKKQPCYVELLFTLGLVQHPLCHLHQGIQMVAAGSRRCSALFVNFVVALLLLSFVCLFVFVFGIRICDAMLFLAFFLFLEV